MKLILVLLNCSETTNRCKHNGIIVKILIAKLKSWIKDCCRMLSLLFYNEMNVLSLMADLSSAYHDNLFYKNDKEQNTHILFAMN